VREPALRRVRSLCEPALRRFGSVREPALRRFRSVRERALRRFGSVREPALRRFRSLREPALRRFGSVRERAMRRFRSPGKSGSFSYASAGDQQGGASRRAPLTPGSGLLHRRFAVPSPLPDFSRTAGTRHPWREPASSRHPCRSS